MSENDRICGFDLRPGESVQFYHRGIEKSRLDRSVRLRRSHYVTIILFVMILILVFAGNLFGGYTPIILALYAVTVGAKLLYELFSKSYLTGKDPTHWDHVAITTQRILLEDNMNEESREIARADITSSKLDFHNGAPVLKLSTLPDMRAPFTLNISCASEAYSALQPS